MRPKIVSKFTENSFNDPQYTPNNCLSSEHFCPFPMQSLVFYVFPVLWYVSCVAFSGNNKSPRQRWEFGRFLKTAGYYNALLPKLPFFSQLSNDRLKLSPKSILWSPENRFPNCFALFVSLHAASLPIIAFISYIIEMSYNGVLWTM